MFARVIGYVVAGRGEEDTEISNTTSLLTGCSKNDEKNCIPDDKYHQPFICKDRKVEKGYYLKSIVDLIFK